MRSTLLLGCVVAAWAISPAMPAAVTPLGASTSSACPSTVSPLVVPLAGSLADVLVDPDCQYIYLTNTTQNRVEIYSLQSLSFEAPIQVGAQPLGMDITPDGTKLYVANSGGNNISVVSLTQRVELRKITIPTVGGSFSPYSIAIADNGKALLSTSNAIYSIRELDLATDVVTVRVQSGMTTNSTFLKASRDRRVIGIASGDISSGPFAIYRTATDAFSATKNMQTYVREVSVNSDGSMFFLAPGSWVVDANLSMSGTVIGASGVSGTAVDPTRGIGYRSTASQIDVINLSTFLKVGQLPLGASVSSSALHNHIGRMDTSADGTLLAVITNTGFSIVRPLVQAPQRLNLVRNGNFGSGMTNWQTYATPDQSYVQSDVTSGVFRYNRLSPPPNSSNQAVVFQETGMALPAGAPIQARFDLGNSSSVRKRISVLLLESDFSDLHVCTFWVPPNAPLAPYRMRSHTTKAWSNAAIYFYAATDGIDGGFNLIDDVSLQYDATLPSDVTECWDPTRPDPPGGPDSAEWLVNGDFSFGVPSPWVLFGTITAQVAGGVLEFLRDSSTPPAGAALQLTGHPVAAREIVTATFDLGNSSTVRKRVTVLLHDSNFTDLSACTFWLAPGQPLSPYSMRTFATQAWANATVSFYAATVDAEAWTRLDNVSFRRTSSAPTFGTDCVEPPAGSPTQGAPLQLTTASGAPSSPPTSASAATSARVGATAPAVSLDPSRRVPMMMAEVESTTLVDLSGAAGARLRFDSWLHGEGRGEVQVSADGVNWTALIDVSPTVDWVAGEVDLGAWVGQHIAVRFARYDDPSLPQASWRVRNVRVIFDRRPRRHD